jgi:hypothetical protein
MLNISSQKQEQKMSALAGYPTERQIVLIYGIAGPNMTWGQRAEAGIDALHFKEALDIKRYERLKEVFFNFFEEEPEEKLQSLETT